jgi:hypothetical protein
LKNSLDSLDRRFETRELELLEGPTQRDDSVWFRLAARYTKAGLPTLEIAGEETVTFRGDRICRMLDTFTPEAAQAAAAYMEQHAGALGSSD